MPNATPETIENETYPMRVASRLTGVSPERMRAWEARYGAIQPQRTEGGTRRYTLLDLERLRLLREVVEAGHRIGDVAGFDDAALEACLPETAGDADDRFAQFMTAVVGLDGTTLRRLLVERMSAMGIVDFAKHFALGLAFEIGARWERGELSISAEHHATGIIRSLLVESLDQDLARLSGRTASAGAGPRIVFATPPGERHDLGLVVAALVAKGAGGIPIFLGADVPEEDLVACVRATRADALALSVVTEPPDHTEKTLRSLRRQLPESVAVWVGGAGTEGCPPLRGVDRMSTLDQVEAFVLEANVAERAGLDRPEALRPEEAPAEEFVP